MKNIHRLFSYIITTSVFLLLLAACNKDIIEADANWKPLTPSKLDTAAGNWKPCVITAGDIFTVPAPDAVNSSAYQKELADVKAAVTNQTAEQQAAIKYWSAGTVLRWNEIMRALVAKYNLAPQDSAGVYPIPNAANPFAYPQFPFSNPPYAARSYAYVSVAQYDALVAAYKFKQQYRRPAPYKTDANITPSVSKSDLYAYPSEEAVVATATFEVMKNLFPTEIEFLNKKAEECRRFKYWAGATTASDIAAGDTLGKQIAAKIMARARTDNMSLAVGNQTKWDSLATRPTLLRTVDGKEAQVADKSWYSEESPKRPPMLPFH
jgi:hypothetical protein